MIKFTVALKEDRTLIGLGISEVNVDRLKRGSPIHIFLEELNLPWKAEIMIFYGKTEQDMANDLKPFIGDATKIHKEE